MFIFNKNGLTYKVMKGKNESIKMFDERLKFIISQNPQTNKHMNEIITYSYVHVNILFLNCKYSDNIMNKLNQYKINI
jgi:hypothetical protein